MQPQADSDGKMKIIAHHAKMSSPRTMHPAAVRTGKNLMRDRQFLFALRSVAAEQYLGHRCALCRAATLARAELNPLRQRQLARKIDRVRLPAHIILPAIAAALAPAAGIFLAAKCATDFRAA